jgi:hypothetical protein
MAQHGVASWAGDYSLSMAKHCCDVVTALTLDVHEEGVWGLDQTLFLVLEFFGGCRRVEEIDY